MNSKAFIDWFAYVAVRVVICIIQAMRIETCHAIARAASVLLNDIVRLRGAVVDDNLRTSSTEEEGILSSKAVTSTSDNNDPVIEP